MSQDQMPKAGKSAQQNVLGVMAAPDVGEVIKNNAKVLDKVRVVHGANHQYFDNLVGKTVGQVRKSLRTAFNLPGDATAYVDGKEVGDDHILAAASVCEFAKIAGIKGAS